MREPVTIRDERPGDAAAIRDLLVAAFAGPAEADLVERLRADGDVVLELVAIAGDAVVGGVVFSRLAVTTVPERALVARVLAPLAVAPDRQRRGIGTALVREGLARLDAAGTDLVLVLGDPDYYGRFGFRPGRPERMVSPYPVPENQWLAPGDRPLPPRMTVAYPRAFSGLA